MPIATRFCTGSYAKAVGWNGNPCLTVYKPSKQPLWTQTKDKDIQKLKVRLPENTGICVVLNILVSGWTHQNADVITVNTMKFMVPDYDSMTSHQGKNKNRRLMALCPGLPRWAGTRKAKQIWILLKQETVSGSGISWAICKSAPCSRQITMPAPHHSLFYHKQSIN